MSREGLPAATRFLVIALSLLYATAAVAAPILTDFGSTRDVVVWIALLLAGAALLLAGQLLTPPGRLSALLVSTGAVLGVLPLFWTLLVPVAVAAVIACSIALARRDAAPA
jgi:hypothetical protein